MTETVQWAFTTAWATAVAEAAARFETDRAAAGQLVEAVQAEALEVERTAAAGARGELAEVRGLLAVLQEQAEKYWNTKDASVAREPGK